MAWSPGNTITVGYLMPSLYPPITQLSIQWEAIPIKECAPLILTEAVESPYMPSHSSRLLLRAENSSQEKITFILSLPGITYAAQLGIEHVI